jgi:hypothetical protein
MPYTLFQGGRRRRRRRGPLALAVLALLLAAVAAATVVTRDAGERAAYDLGFEHIAAGPLVRSSYHADEHVKQSQPGVGPVAAPA